MQVADDVEDLSQTATKEFAVSSKLEEIVAQWGKLEFSFAVYKGRAGSYIFKGAEAADLQEILEESLMILGGMANSRYALPFKQQVDEWVNILGETGEVMERWLYLQVQRYSASLLNLAVPAGPVDELRGCVHGW